VSVPNCETRTQPIPRVRQPQSDGFRRHQLMYCCGLRAACSRIVPKRSQQHSSRSALVCNSSEQRPWRMNLSKATR